MLLSLFNDSPGGVSDSHFERFRSERVLEKLDESVGRAETGGLAQPDPAREPLVALGMEQGPSGRPAGNCYGAFGLSWKARQNPEWAERIAAEAAGLRERIHAAHRTPLRYMIWAGMGSEAEDKSMYNAAGLLKRGPRCYVLDSTDPAKLRGIFDNIGRRHGLPMPAILRSTLVVAMAMGMSSFEPVVNLERLEALYEKHRVDGRANFVSLALPGSPLDQFANRRGYRKLEFDFDGAGAAIGRVSGPLTRGSLLPLALAKTDIERWLRGSFLTAQQVHTAWRLAATRSRCCCQSFGRAPGFGPSRISKRASANARA